MQEEKEEIITNNQVADSGGKIIFENPTLCSQLLSNYSGLEILKNVKPEDIEDVTERFIPMFTEQRDADVVKKVNLSDEEVFVALIEHKSGVDYNVAMQILRYMVYIWEDYERQMEKEHRGVTHTKNFKYPPILPIVYYEDKPEWSVSELFKSRIALDEVFAEYIPNFKYHLISLNSFEEAELIDKKDGLSLVMLVNRIRNETEFKQLNLPKDYMDKLLADSPRDVLGAIAKVVSVILRKHNVPENEINGLVDQLKEERSMALFDNYVATFDVQEERRTAREKTIIGQTCAKLRKGLDTDSIASMLEEPPQYIAMICEVARRPELEYDVDKIFDAISEGAYALSRT